MMHYATSPNTACRTLHGLARYARCSYYMEHEDIKVAWNAPELKDYFLDEDITDDYR